MTLRAAALLALGLAGTAHAALPPDELFKLVSPSVWRVMTAGTDGKPLASGSAVVIAPETLVTNCHVLKGASSVAVRQKNTTHRARLQHADTERDLCQLKVAGMQAPALTIAPEPARVGQRVYTIGSPVGLEATLSDGLVSGLRPTAPGGGYIQISAPISPGSSGGGLFDEDGRLLGITTSGIVGVAQNLNFARPASLIAEIPERSAVALQRWREARAAGSAPALAAPDAAPAPPARNDPPVASIPPQAPARPSAPPTVPATATQPGRIATGFAAIDDIDAIPYLNDRGREGYRDWLGKSTPRAFALASNGRWAASWGVRGSNPGDSPDPSDRALANCERTAKMPCRLYAVNRAVVWVKDTSPATAALPQPDTVAPSATPPTRTPTP